MKKNVKKRILIFFPLSHFKCKMLSFCEKSCHFVNWIESRDSSYNYSRTQSTLWPPYQTVQNKPFVSSFSHALPGTNSYMSVTRYFNQPSPAVPTHEATRTQVPSTSALSLNDPLNQSSGDNFHPFNPRFEVGSDSDSRVQVNVC